MKHLAIIYIVLEEKYIECFAQRVWLPRRYLMQRQIIQVIIRTQFEPRFRKRSLHSKTDMSSLSETSANDRDS